MRLGMGEDIASCETPIETNEVITTTVAHPMSFLTDTATPFVCRCETQFRYALNIGDSNLFRDRSKPGRRPHFP